MIDVYATSDQYVYTASDGSRILLGFNLITDRTQTDANYVRDLIQKVEEQTATNKEQEALISGAAKGMYSAYHLNRVGYAMSFIRDWFKSLGYVVDISPRTDWGDAEWVSLEDAAQYLKMAESLRSVFAVLQSTPQVPSDMESFSWGEANDIEQILEDLHYLLNMIPQNTFYSGELYGGEL